ncbi:MAG: M56 family metallopeptidase [Gelidibacter sp.]
MLIYILKFSACLAIFMAFYNLFLEKTSIHNFKRFYLLTIVVLALGIPLITFIQYVEPTVNTATFKEMPQINFEPQAIYQPTLLDYLPQILWCIYGLGVLVFGINFLRNLAQIIKKIRQNPKHKIGLFTNVLLLDLIIPHTFFNYIFLNKTKYETQQIPDEVLLHEKTHATQKHSLDVLFIELLQIVFWFNPLIYFIKHSIKLNHEFLADQAVLKQGIQPSSYQHILLAFSSYALEPKLTNAINYSSIKKRFTVMKTHTSKQKIWLRSFLLLPLIALTLYGFSETKVVEKENLNQVFEGKIIEGIVIYVNKDDELLINGKSVKLKKLSDELNKLNTNLTQEEKRKFLSANIQYEDEKNIDIIKKIQSVLVKSDIWSSSTTNVEMLKQLGMSSALPKNKYAGKTIEEANSIYDEEKIDFSTRKENDSNSPWQIGVGVNEVIYDKNDTIQQQATTEEVEEYNKLAKHYNTQPENKRVVKLKDLKRLEYLFNKMSKEQKAVAEPFPNCPPPPPAPDAPKVMKGNDVPPPPPIPANATPEQKKKMQKVIDNYNTQIPPPPPPPKTPLNHVIEMAKKGATFYYENKLISLDEAKELLKQDGSFNISTTQDDSKVLKVYISKAPIKTINNNYNSQKQNNQNKIATSITDLKIDTDNLYELKNIDWNLFKEIFSDNAPETMITLEFNYIKPVMLNESTLDSFNYKIKCKTSEFDEYTKKAQQAISKLKPIN